jgi:type II secretory pathway pseudopilin PulG
MKLHLRVRISGGGFSLVETMVGLAILTIVMSAVFSQLNQVQKASASEAAKMDLTQQAREFVDQMVRDLHMTGYPRPDMYSPPLPLDNALVAAGLVRVSPTEILLEGDVETSGNVYSVDIQYVAADATDPQCPCVRRSEVVKGSLTPANKYTQLEQVMPPGTGAGQSGEDLFTFFDKNGNQVDVTGGADISTPSGQTTIGKIQTVKINLSLLSPNSDPVTKLPQRFSLSVTGHLNEY